MQLKVTQVRAGTVGEEPRRSFSPAGITSREIVRSQAKKAGGEKHWSTLSHRTFVIGFTISQALSSALSTEP